MRGLISSKQYTIWIRGLIQILDLQQLLCVNINNKRDIIWRILNNMRPDKTSNMLFLNDLSSSEVFQKMRLDFMFLLSSKSIIHELFIQQ